MSMNKVDQRYLSEIVDNIKLLARDAGISLTVRKLKSFDQISEGQRSSVVGLAKLATDTNRVSNNYSKKKSDNNKKPNNKKPNTKKQSNKIKKEYDLNDLYEVNMNGTSAQLNRLLKRFEKEWDQTTILYKGDNLWKVITSKEYIGGCDDCFGAVYLNKKNGELVLLDFNNPVDSSIEYEDHTEWQEEVDREIKRHNSDPNLVVLFTK